MRYTLKERKYYEKVGCCFYCKKNKPVDDFAIVEELAEFYRGVCNKCYARHKRDSWEYTRSVRNYKKNTLSVFNKFKEDYIRMEGNYFKELQDTLINSPNKLPKIIKMFKYGIKMKYIYSYCRVCLEYKTSPILKKDGITYRKEGRIKSICTFCEYQKNKKFKKYDPVRQRVNRIMWENTIVIDEVTNETTTKDKLRLKNRYRRNVKLTPEVKEFYRELIIKGNELSKILGEEIQLDHIIPIKGKYVSGLNHPDNIQFLYKNINNTKNNKMIFKEGLSFEELKTLNTLNYDGFNPYLNIPFEEYLKLCV